MSSNEDAREAELPIVVTRDSEVPLYLQIKHQVRFLIISGKLNEGALLPSVRRLGTHLGINPNTVSQAYKELMSDGLVVSYRGQGTFVNAFSSSLHNAEGDRLQMLTDLLAYAHLRTLSLGFTSDDFRQSLNAVFLHSVPRHLVVVMETEKAALKYGGILTETFGDKQFRFFTTTLAEVESGTSFVLEMFETAYFAITLSLYTRHLEDLFESLQIKSQVIPLTVDITKSCLKKLGELGHGQNIFLVAEERNIPTALNLVLQNSPVSYKDIEVVSPEHIRSSKMVAGEQLVIHTFGVSEELDGLAISVDRRLELTFNLSDQSIRTIYERLNIAYTPLGRTK